MDKKKLNEQVWRESALRDRGGPHGLTLTHAAKVNESMLDSLRS